PALTALASMLSARLTRRAHVDDRLLERLSFFIGWVLVGYLYFRFWDAFAMTYTYEPGRTEGLNLITQGPLSFNFWIVEILLGAVIPIVILLNPRLRRNPLLRMLALALVVVGVVAYRWDTNLAGQMVVMSYLPQDISARYTTYFPSLIEFVSGAGIVAYGLLAFTLGVRFLNVVDHRHAQHHEAQPEAKPALAVSD
ncbi:MAG TPA: NrfD/PsrC family molybdoenzyme membrane anchor subunit, partial [Anaerolineae bacterium]|nr:NrfD/PsrC family molybdoenzyme membrane anchor subunit [Anaerolineae bacterium]